MLTNRRFVLKLLATSALFGVSAPVLASSRKPNFIIVLCDDLGLGDIEPTGGRRIPTPNLNRMAREGMLLTDYYAPQNVCTPSRAGLLTGRYPIRTGLAQLVILQFDERVLPVEEVTIAEALKPAGYVSGLFGKWHLGHLGPDWQPTKHGFDRAVGIPLSHDATPLWLFTDVSPEVEPTREDAVLDELQQRFYADAESFIETNAHRPFFVELALSAPHLPSHPNAKHRNPEMQSAYEEVVGEIDAIMGRLMRKLRALRLERETIVIFTSDNGPGYEGSSGGLRDRKGGAGYEGGYRVPCIVWRPGTVPAGRRCNSITMGIDFLPTFCAMAGVSPPNHIPIDGKDISAVITRGAPSPHESLILFDEEEVSAIRTQQWKFVANTYYHGNLRALEKLHPQLYDMSDDQSETYSVAERHPDVVAEMQDMLTNARQVFGPLKLGDRGRPKIPPAGSKPSS